MKAFLVIIVSIAFALVLKIVDYISNRKNNAYGESNLNKQMPKIDITNEEELKKALGFYKGMPD